VPPRGASPEGAEELPDGWTWSTIPDLVGKGGVFSDGDWVESVDQDPNGDVRLIQLADVGDGSYRDRSERFMTKAKAEELRCTFLKDGDVLIARMPDPLGRACIFPGDPKPSVTVVDVCIVRSANGEFDHRWLSHFVNAHPFRSAIAGLQAGSTRKRISRGNLATIPLPLPPLPEQRRIVAEIEKQFTRLEAGVAALRRVQANLKRYRAAVLKAACEGRLVPTEAELTAKNSKSTKTKPASLSASTALSAVKNPGYETGAERLARILTERRKNWEANAVSGDTAYKGKRAAAVGRVPSRGGRGQYKEPAAPDTANLPPLPAGWTWATLDQLLIYLRNGWGWKPDAETGTPILRISSNRPMSVNLDDVRFLSGPVENYAEYFVTEGDLLFTRYNGNANLTGVCGIVPALDTKIVHPDKLIRVRLVPKLCLPKFVGMVANVGVSRAFVASRARTTAGQTGISGPDLRGIPIMLPPLAEQTRIVAEVERRLSVVEELEAVVTANLQRATRLRQSILQKAFTGRLV
jgi:type I restriction enzyme S subunit